jgi:hypothetical protein
MRFVHTTDAAAAQRPPSGMSRERNPHSRIPFCAK